MWRCIALVVGLVFLVRYFVHLREYLRAISPYDDFVGDGLSRDLNEDIGGDVRLDRNAGSESLSLVSNDDDRVSPPEYIETV